MITDTFFKMSTVRISIGRAGTDPNHWDFASGFIAMPNEGRYLIISASHVFLDKKGIPQGDEIKVEYFGSGLMAGQIFDFSLPFSAATLNSNYMNDGLDLAVIDWPSSLGFPSHFLLIRLSSPNSNEMFQVCGHSTQCFGIKKLRSISNQLYAQNTFLFASNQSEVGMGDSGGAIIDSEGKVLAVASSGIGDTNLLRGCALFSNKAYSMMGSLPVL